MDLFPQLWGTCSLWDSLGLSRLSCEQVLYLFYKTFTIPIGELFYAEVWSLSDLILFIIGWDFGPYGSFQGCVVLHINGTYLCFPHELSTLTFLFLFLLPFTFLRLKPANISSLNYYLAFFIEKGDLDFKGTRS